MGGGGGGGGRFFNIKCFNFSKTFVGNSSLSKKNSATCIQVSPPNYPFFLSNVNRNCIFSNDFRKIL